MARGIKQKAQLSQTDRAGWAPRGNQLRGNRAMLLVIEYFAKSLKITRIDTLEKEVNLY